MMKRRIFLKTTPAIAAMMGIFTVGKSMPSSIHDIDKFFIHHVFFWLKDPDNMHDRRKFENELKNLASIETIKVKQIGIPADTDRPVIDNTYHYSLLLGFKDKAGHDIYQKHTKHLDFINKCENIWDRVLVYDSVNIKGT